MNERHERGLSNLFDIGLLIKAAEGSLEIIAALAISLVPRAFVARIADVSTAGELTEDPNDFMANHIRAFAHTYALHAHDLFAALLTLDGAVKVALVALVFAGYSFAFPLFIVAVAVLGSYEAYRAIETANILLFVLVAYDIALILLVAYEYRRRYSSSA